MFKHQALGYAIRRLRNLPTSFTLHRVISEVLLRQTAMFERSRVSYLHPEVSFSDPGFVILISSDIAP